MAPPISLKLGSRSQKQRIKKLPTAVEIPSDATVEDAKKIIARAAGVKDYNRIGLFYPSTKKIIKDRKALISNEEDVVSNGEILVQDLGAQMAWRTVYMVEYAGPILFHCLFIAIRPYLANVDPYFYKGADKTPLTTIQWLCFWLFQAHFVKRELETVFVHKFAANTMPAWMIFRNSFFYWAFAGLLSGFFIYSPKSPAARSELTPLDLIGLGLYVYGEVCNAIVHLHLASLRSRGGTEKGIPTCIGSSLVTCPNYMFEVISWVGIILISREWAVVVFIATGTFYMAGWSRDKEKALRATFGDKYKKKRYTMLPGLI
ncbi:Very-long-chain enoyl-CoA reductase [Pleurostoma richardsiae]|uniref:Very-long-chain enoyl-CoA reductase n=1 Tax=Pleurostoma richardsiae TaxID=41990 RepID=A0AA38R999_9PEZI|nr:Very-long-chain enoyl-CoA reductase [Pleurostoma richardsiae]